MTHPDKNCHIKMSAGLHQKCDPRYCSCTCTTSESEEKDDGLETRGLTKNSEAQAIIDQMRRLEKEANPTPPTTKKEEKEKVTEFELKDGSTLLLHSNGQWQIKIETKTCEHGRPILICSGCKYPAPSTRETEEWIVKLESLFNLYPVESNETIRLEYDIRKLIREQISLAREEGRRKGIEEILEKYKNLTLGELPTASEVLKFISSLLTK